jgi:hypothetical protein
MNLDTSGDRVGNPCLVQHPEGQFKGDRTQTLMVSTYQIPVSSLSRHSMVLSFGRMVRYQSIRAAHVETAVEYCLF